MKCNVNELLSLLKESTFLSKNLKEYILGLQFEAEDFSEDELKTLLQSLTTFLKEWLSKFPESGQKVPLDEFSGCLSKLESKLDVSEFTSEVDSLLEIRDQALKRRAEQKKLKKSSMKGGNILSKPKELKRKPSDDFRELPVEPTSEEIASGKDPQESLRINRTGKNQKYEDLDDYLDLQFRLLREDFVGPLREGIKEIKVQVSKEDRSYDLSKYEDVKLMTSGFTSSGLVRKIGFRPFLRKKEFWQHSKRLLFGSFLCLSKDNFKTMAFASVADRKPEDLAKGFVDVRFIDGMEPDVKNNERFVMVESPAYFESYRHVLRRLKEITSENFPFQNYLVSCSPDVERPVYLRDPNMNKPIHYDLTEALGISVAGANANVEVLNQQAWPSEDVVQLNGSQYEAIKAALTKEFVVIQGPPGTGERNITCKEIRSFLISVSVLSSYQVSS
jgi:hypothetical protein